MKARRYLAAEDGFLGLPLDQAGPPEDARAVVVPFGLEATVSYGSGTRHGPAAIIAASHQVELFDELRWKEPLRPIGVATLAPFEVEASSAAALEQLAAVVGGLVAEGRFPLVLGGEHSLTAGAVRPHVQRHERLAVLHFDAHADLRDSYEGDRLSHASAMRRVLDSPGVRVVSVGVRNVSVEEARWLDSSAPDVTLYWARDRAQYVASEIVSALGGLPVYISLDVDVFDSSLMPATGTPEPGGLFWDDVLSILNEAGRRCQIVGADIVELAPIDGWHACDFLAAKLAYRVLCAALGEGT